ncbi:MAG: ATP-dependent RecD-like DNA helicase [Lachnospiraceae bacterium]|nr:ATP-dependent RecD-like DNA helicase [Lachnospiraceae bacterium]
MEVIKGYVEKIVYRNADNGYTVMSVNTDGEDMTCVGIFHYIGEGEYLELKGEFKDHPTYGVQMNVSEYEVIAPEDEIAMIRYLGSGAIKGVKVSTATKIVNRFKQDTFRIMEEEPERLAEIKGISMKKAMEIAEQMEEKKDMRKAMIFLGQYGISMTLAVKIYNYYGPGLYDIVRLNPYKMADDIEGIGFKIADEIASHVGISRDSDFRIKSGILYALQQAALNGNVFVPREKLVVQAEELLGISDVDMQKHLMDLTIDKRIVIRDLEVYASNFYYTELQIARKLMDLNEKAKINEAKTMQKLNDVEDAEGIALDEMREQAVIEAVRCGLLIITGGPGTGKTTTIKTIIRYFESEEMEIRLAAPTGRAAKRMQEATGMEAQTIHRMLELNGNPESDSKGAQFERNEMNPLEADVIIIDEMSMVDIFLMQALLKAVMPGTRLILVGDTNQLPSVGPGNVLRDIIASGMFPVVRLEKIFRQAATSDIVMNAHKINRGEPIDLAKRSLDFLFIRRNDADSIIAAMLTLIQEKLPSYVNAEISDIQVLTPARKGLLGVERLNSILQKYLNPPDEKKIEKETAACIFREGDKVMQIKNDYQIEWEIRGRYNIVTDKGMGVFNGDVGIIRRINTYTEYLEVEFEENKFVTYTFKQLDELELAYAITIHKSQGSEYPAVIMPMYPGPRMLMNRNLLYTSVTRAKKCVCMVGNPEVFVAMEANDKEQERYSGLKARILEMMEEENWT